MGFARWGAPEVVVGGFFLFLTRLARGRLPFRLGGRGSVHGPLSLSCRGPGRARRGDSGVGTRRWAMVGTTSAFQQFVESEYKLSHWANQQQDRARRRPVVKPAAIFRAAVGQAAWSLGSVLKVDQWLRTRTAQRFIGQSPDARCRGSDSTLLRALGAWELGPARDASYAVHLWQRDQGRAKRTLASGRSVRLAVVDGRCFGGVWGSGLGFAGGVYYSVDGERYAGRG